MKTLKLVITVSLLTLVLVVNRFAGTSQAAKNELSVYKQIESQMSYPEFGKGDHVIGKVIVEFRCDENGKVKILNMNYSNSRLKNYVSEKLAKMTIQLPLDNTEDIYRVVFTFNLI